MLNQITTIKMLVSCFALMILISPTLSYAGERDHRDERHFYHYHDRPSFGLHLSFVPEGAFILGVDEARYYYYDGLYYSRMGGEYVLVTPPIGAVVAAIPPEYQPVVVNGVTYYVDNGVYYVYTRYGYQVVPQPVTVVQAAPAVVTQPAPVPAIVPAPTTPPQATAVSPAQAVPTPTTPSADESFTVNIPNAKGGYTAVTIKRSGAGFVGPQGEFYAEFPKVAQLQAMYGK